MRNPFSKAVLAAVLFQGVSSVTLHADDDWQVIRCNNRDYLSLDNVAHFYRLQGDTRRVDNKITLGDERVHLEMTGDAREVYINGVKQWLSFPVIVKDGQHLISRFDLAKTIEPALRPTMIENLQPFRTVVLDAGHGGQDRGANSITGFEKDYTLSVIKYLKRSLQAKGFHVMTTRDADVYVPLDGRAQRANDIKDAIFVSVHFNSSNDGGLANGFEVFAMTPRGASSTGDSGMGLEQLWNFPGNDFDNASLALANCVHHSILGHIPQADRGVKRARFVVLKNTHAPAILVEGGFLTNATEGSRINDVAWRQKLAESISQGVQSYAGLADKKLMPKLLADYQSEQLPLVGTIVNANALADLNKPKAAASVLPVSNDQSTSLESAPAAIQPAAAPSLPPMH